MNKDHKKRVEYEGKEDREEEKDEEEVKKSGEGR